MKENKWLNGALPAILIHGSIGSVYAWSNLVTSVSESMGKSENLVRFAFSLAIFFLGMSAAFGGRIVEKNIHVSSRISMLFFCVGLLMTGVSIHFKSIPLLYISYGAIMGIGLGVGYLTPVKTLMLWFDKNKGLATGIAVCAFGFANTIANQLNHFLLERYSLEKVFLLLGVIYAIPMAIGSFLLKKPSWWVEDEVSNSSFNPMIMWKDHTFVKIWFVMFINILCGISLIAKAEPIMKVVAGENSIFTLQIVGVIGIFNGLGRIVISTLSDKLNKRIHIYNIISLAEALAMVCVMAFKQPIILFIALCIIATGYGAGFSCLPSLLSDIYGSKNISKIHGLSLTSWAMAGLLSVFISNISDLSVIMSILLVGYGIVEGISTSVNYIPNEE